MGSQKPITTKGGLPKKGRACTVCKFKGGLARKRVGVFEGVDIPMHMREQQVKWIFDKLQLTVVLPGEITMKKIRVLIDFHDFCKTFLLIWLVSGKNIGQKCYFHESRSVLTFQAN